jgi:hypothetical protein
MIENRGFDSHSLRYLHDFVRQPMILDYCVRDSALLGLDAWAGRNYAGCPYNYGSGPECNRAMITAGFGVAGAACGAKRPFDKSSFWCEFVV